MNELTAAVPVQEYRVITTMDRILSRSACDEGDLLRMLVREGHFARHIELWSDWEARDKQAEPHEEHNRITEEEAAA
jgi:hypothetical protein